MLSRGHDEFDGARRLADDLADAIFGGDELVGGDEYASDDDGGTSVPGAEADAEEEDDSSPWADDGGVKESSGELGSGGDVACPVCGKFFKNEKAMFGHLRSHPNRGYKGATPAEKKLKPSSPCTDDAGSPASSSPNIDDGSSDGKAAQQAPPPSRSFSERKLDSVDEQIDAGIGGSVAVNVAVEAKTEDPGPEETASPLLGDELDGSIAKIPKKRKRSISKEDGEPSRKVKLVKTTTTKEKRPYMCKHCKAEFSTHQALGGHMAGHHREKKAPALNTKETSMEHQGVGIQSQNGKQAKGGDETMRAGLSLSSRRMQVEQLSMAPNMGWLSAQAPGGSLKLHFVRRNHGTPPVVAPAAADGDRHRLLNIDLNVEAPEQE